MPGTAVGTDEFQLLDADGRIAIALDCAKCGYDLRGRRLGERCSECATLVTESIDAAELRIGSPGRARRYRLCIRAFQIVVVMAMAMPVVGGCLAFGPLVALAPLFVLVAPPALITIAILIQDAPDGSPIKFTVGLILVSIGLATAFLLVGTGTGNHGDWGYFLVLLAAFERGVGIAGRSIARVTVFLDRRNFFVRLAQGLFGLRALVLDVLVVLLLGTLLHLTRNGLTNNRDVLAGVAVLMLLFLVCILQWVRALFTLWWCQDILRSLRPPPSDTWLGEHIYRSNKTAI